MCKLINADTVVHWQSYDDEHETFPEDSGTIADFLDQMTEEGCPEAVDAIPVRRGRWIRVYSRPGVFKYLGWTCDQCRQRTGNEYAPQYYKFCPYCGAKMDGKENGNETN